MKQRVVKVLQYFGKHISSFFIISFFIIGCNIETPSKSNRYIIEKESVADLNFDGIQDTIFILSPLYLIDSLKHKNNCSNQNLGRVLKVVISSSEANATISYKGVLLNEISYDMYPGVETVWTYGDSIILQYETGQGCIERYRINIRLQNNILIYEGFEYQYRCGTFVYDGLDSLYKGEELKHSHRKHIDKIIFNYRDSLQNR